MGKLDDLQRQLKELKAKQKAQQEVLKARIQKAKAGMQNQERKARTRRLITIGGLIEKHCGKVENLEELEQYIIRFAEAIKRAIHTPLPDPDPAPPADADQGNTQNDNDFPF